MKHATYFALIAAIAFTSCQRKMTSPMAYKMDNKHVNPHTQIWQGTYRGTIVTPDCASAQMTITLLKDMDYVMTSTCAGSAQPGLRKTGKYLVDASQKILTLTSGNGRQVGRFLIEGSSLAQVDAQGNKMYGAFATQYMLKR